MDDPSTTKIDCRTTMIGPAALAATAAMPSVVGAQTTSGQGPPMPVSLMVNGKERSA